MRFKTVAQRMKLIMKITIIVMIFPPNFSSIVKCFSECKYCKLRNNQLLICAALCDTRFSYVLIFVSSLHFGVDPVYFCTWHGIINTYPLQ